MDWVTIKFLEPQDAPDRSGFRLVEMYSKLTDVDVKEDILKSFTRTSPLRIVCATVAFGMGVDCEQIIHLGAPAIQNLTSRRLAGVVVMGGCVWHRYWLLIVTICFVHKRLKTIR